MQTGREKYYIGVHLLTCVVVKLQVEGLKTERMS